MAHNINRNALTGKDAFFSVKEKAWHGLGQIVEDYPTSAEALKFAGLDFEVKKQNLYAETQAYQIGVNNDMEKLKSHFATVRTDTNQILGVVGKKYQIVQNKQAFTFFDKIVGGGDGIKYETAGALGDGERIFITAKLPDQIRVDKNDLIEQYIFLTTSHDGSGAIMAAFTPVRIVCNNTLSAAIGNCSNTITIRHTASAVEQLKEAHKVMGISHQLAAELEPILQKMARNHITDKDTRRLISLAMAPTDIVFQAVRDNRTNVEFSSQYENIIGGVMQYAMTSESQQMASTAGTVFGAYNAITGYYQNAKDWRTDDEKLKSILFGGGADRTKKAFEICQNAEMYIN